MPLYAVARSLLMGITYPLIQKLFYKNVPLGELYEPRMVMAGSGGSMFGHGIVELVRAIY